MQGTSLEKSVLFYRLVVDTHLFDLIILQLSEVVGQKLCGYHPAPLLWGN